MVIEFSWNAFRPQPSKPLKHIFYFSLNCICNIGLLPTNWITFLHCVICHWGVFLLEISRCQKSTSEHWGQHWVSTRNLRCMSMKLGTRKTFRALPVFQWCQIPEETGRCMGKVFAACSCWEFSYSSWRSGLCGCKETAENMASAFWTCRKHWNRWFQWQLSLFYSNYIYM